MGRYINPGNGGFAESVNSQIYIDKSELIEYTNSVINTMQKYICVSRPRRFGKSIAANMLAAYYGMGDDSHCIFDRLKIKNSSDYEKYINKFDVIFMNMQDFLSESEETDKLIGYIRKRLMRELVRLYGEVIYPGETALSAALSDIYAETGRKFIFIIDEWDCIFREKKNDSNAQTAYLDFLRNLLKDKSYAALIYMTGILPIKKYGTHSALNMFDEYSMTKPSQMDIFMGFTEDEVIKLSEEYSVDFEQMKSWYDGYILNGCHIYNPKSVVDSIRRKSFDSYWTGTETYEALRKYIDMNIDGLRNAVIDMLGGNRFKIDTGSFQNDMTTFNGVNDVLTLLVHLGYLSYDEEKKEVFIPNNEIRIEFERAVRISGWDEVINAIASSEKLLEATLNGKENEVAFGIDKVHMETTSVLSYNNENSLSCVITLAYYSARRSYKIIREFPAGKGFADIIFLPKRNTDLPAMIVELKWDLSAEGAIHQIKNKKYMNVLENYSGEIVLVGINYNKNDKRHECKIEKINNNN